MLNINKHRVILIQILKDIYSDIEISSLLGFKGGTAVYFFYQLTRFSVDLDFNLLDSNKKTFVFEKIKNIVSAHGELKEASQKQNTLFFLLSYERETRNLKIEISTRMFEDSYEVKDYLGIPVLVMKQEDMFAHKMAALLDRKSLANRDLYDIIFFIKNRWDCNLNLLEKRTGMATKDYIDRCVHRVNQVNNTYILQGLGELLTEPSKDSMREKMKDEILFYLKLFKEGLINKGH
ncbi:MAG: nucleotidyl transferase AbiEii/AbiGii toxin family protein [Candidatus Omnitrophica bacterium]|nr:nucleotidyl transferase AbiEii/AbiGii toxin family protein [Candidatus Omnitrophota bacterium]